MTGGQPTIQLFVKITIFEFLYFLKFESELHETSGFYYIQYGESIYGLKHLQIF